MKKKLVGMLFTVVMVSTLLAGCGKSSTSKDTTVEKSSTDTTAKKDTDAKTSGIKITMLNTKSEIQTQFEEMAIAYEKETGVKIEVYTATGDSPSEEIAKKYAAGDAPTLIMGDPQDVAAIALEKAVDLSGEEWASLGGNQYGITVDGKLYSLPFCIEARGLIYNKTAIEKVTGKEFNPSSIKSMDDLQALLDELVAGGMETPVALNKEDWSLAAHYLTLVYEEQDGTNATTSKFIDGLYAGTENLGKNTRFNAVMDTFDMLKKYNMNKSDPLAADIELNAAAIAEGDIAFWFHGNWAWTILEEYVEDGTEMGIMPVVQNDTTGNANVNTYLCGSATKQIMIDKVCSTPEQQKAAKDFLNWLVNSEKGQDFLVNVCNVVPAFSNIKLEVKNPLGISVQNCVENGQLFDGYIYYPGDHWKEVGASMQKYLADQITRDELATEITNYWDALK